MRGWKHHESIFDYNGNDLCLDRRGACVACVRRAFAPCHRPAVFASYPACCCAEILGMALIETLCAFVSPHLRSLTSRHHAFDPPIGDEPHGGDEDVKSISDPLVHEREPDGCKITNERKLPFAVSP